MNKFYIEKINQFSPADRWRDAEERIIDIKRNKKISLTENGMTLKLVGINNTSNELQSIVNVLSQNGIAFTEINTVDNSLEDIFLDLVETQ